MVQGSVLVRPGCILRADAHSARGSSVMKYIIERAIIFSTFATQLVAIVRGMLRVSYMPT